MNDHIAAPSESSASQSQSIAQQRQFTEEHCRTLLEAAPVAVVIQRDGVLLYANAAALELFGAPSFERLASRALIDLVHADDRAHFIRNVLLPAKGEKILPCEIRCVRLDDATIWMEAICVEVFLKGERTIEIILRDITKRKQNEGRIRQQTFVLDGINRILHAALKFETEEELGRACLEIAEEITQSRTGFIGEIREAGLEKIALTMHASGDEEIIRATIAHSDAGQFDMHRLYSPVLMEGRSFFSNDTAAHSHEYDVPRDHPAIESFLGVPLSHEGRTIGMIGLANKPGGYSSTEQEFVEALAPAVVEAFMRQRMESEVQKLYAQTRRDAVTKTDLLNEINHRVKNNLMTILGLILAEKRHMPLEQTAVTERFCEKFELRIGGLLKVHQILSDSQWTPMNIGELALHICSGVLDSFGMAERITLSISDSDIDVSPRQANNIALIFNELMTNSLKYAFRETERPAVDISIRREDDMACIVFRDNGAGFPADVLSKGVQHVGLKLVEHLTEDTLDGEVLLYNDGGSVAVLRIRIEAPARHDEQHSQIS